MWVRTPRHDCDAFVLEQDTSLYLLISTQEYRRVPLRVDLVVTTAKLSTATQSCILPRELRKFKD